jgi:hypothetical protein
METGFVLGNDGSVSGAEKAAQLGLSQPKSQASITDLGEWNDAHFLRGLEVASCIPSSQNSVGAAKTGQNAGTKAILYRADFPRTSDAPCRRSKNIAKRESGCSAVDLPCRQNFPRVARSITGGPRGLRGAYSGSIAIVGGAAVVSVR